jgi:AraC-like DNA-binding protein
MTSVKTSPNKTPKRIRSHYGRGGSLLKIRVRDSLYISMQELKDLFEASTGKTFTHSILVRRALQQYIKDVKKLDPEFLKLEALWLISHYR